MDFSDPVVLIALGVFFVAGFVKGVVGMGLPTVSIGLMSLAVPLSQAAVLLVIPSLVTNIWQAVVGGRLGALLKRFWLLFVMMFAGVALGGWLGIAIAGTEAGATAVSLLGVLLVASALLSLFKPAMTIPVAQESWLSPVTGVLTGLATSVTGVFVVPSVSYLQALHMEKEELIQALGITFTVGTLALGASLIEGEVFTGPDAALSAVAVVPALIGMWIGQKVLRRIDVVLFRRCFLGSLLILGTHLAVRPWL